MCLYLFRSNFKCYVSELFAEPVFFKTSEIIAFSFHFSRHFFLSLFLRLDDPHSSPSTWTYHVLRSSLFGFLSNEWGGFFVPSLWSKCRWKRYGAIASTHRYNKSSIHSLHKVSYIRFQKSQKVSLAFQSYCELWKFYFLNLQKYL